MTCPLILELCRTSGDFQVPGMTEHSGTRCWTDFSLRDGRSAACGESGMVGSLSGRHAVGANRPDRATKSQGNLFFYGGHNGRQDIVWKSISPLKCLTSLTNIVRKDHCRGVPVALQVSGLPARKLFLPSTRPDSA